MKLDELRQEALHLSLEDQAELINSLVESRDRASAEKAQMTLLLEAINVGERDIAEGRSLTLSASEVGRYLDRLTAEVLGRPHLK
ncbi:MAG: hypothetical protein Q7U82_03070 [Gammaproteobacteria bacterium]|nr:hypothetical protein [Gammaproteobacteria bacterium]MDO9317694.1 hypothetical protein [Gammaproteobacteria bacterium]